MSTTADFHLHSDRSDGVLAPRALVRHVAAQRVTCMALTDHDTTSGCAEAASECAAAGLGFVHGVEVSACWRGGSIHVIGLGLRASEPALESHLEALRAQRRARIVEIGERLERRARLPGAQLAAEVVARHEVPTRLHLARELVRAGFARDLQQVFDRWLARGKEAHVPAQWPALEPTLAALRAADASIVLAHAHRYRLSGGALRALVAEFKSHGGDALEVSVGGMARHDLDRLATLARGAGLAASSGSDFHDPQIAWNTPGRFAKLPADLEPVAARLAA